jgi:hypothetical protein
MPHDDTETPGREYTQFMAAEITHAACRVAWLYPDDHELRLAAIVACAATGLDYIATLASLMENMGATAEQARRKVAESYRVVADKLYAEHGFQVAP